MSMENMAKDIEKLVDHFMDTRMVGCREFGCMENFEGKCNLRRIFIMDGHRCHYYQEKK